MRNRQPIIRLIARLLFGLSVLALLSLLSAEMAIHHFQGTAERAVRQVFTEGIHTENGEDYDVICRGPDLKGGLASPCDPTVVALERSIRSASCGGRSLLRLLGRQWRCVARFTDGATLRVDVSLGFRQHRLELLLPVRALPGGATEAGVGATHALNSWHQIAHRPASPGVPGALLSRWLSAPSR